MILRIRLKKRKGEREASAAASILRGQNNSPVVVVADICGESRGLAIAFIFQKPP